VGPALVEAMQEGRDVEVGLAHVGEQKIGGAGVRVGRDAGRLGEPGVTKEADDAVAKDRSVGEDDDRRCGPRVRR